MELIDGESDYHRRFDIGAECIEVAAGHVIDDDTDPDRETFASDAISDILTAMFGPAGAYYNVGGGYWFKENGDAIKKARALLDHALDSYEGDSEDYEVEPPAAA